MAKEVLQKTNYAPTFRFVLEPYKGLKSRFTCPNCGSKHSFARYVDVTTGSYVGDDYGRCNKETHCGYIKPPVTDKPVMVTSNKVIPEYVNYSDNNINLIPSSNVLRSLSNYEDNNFIKFLYSKFNHDDVRRAIEMYKIGTSCKWGGATIFWQIDKDFETRTGKIMLYDENTGKRVKDPYNHISWVHSIYTDYNLKQCFFGEHLITDEEQDVCIVESEKTAIICSIVRPNKVWLATGGLMNINECRLLPLHDKKMTFFPDKGEAYFKWCERLTKFEGDYDFEVSNILNTDNGLEEGEDLGDLVLKSLVN